MRENYSGYNKYEMAFNQFFSSSVTLNVPQFMLDIKSTTLNKFDNQVFPLPLEIPYYFSCGNNCNEIKSKILQIFKSQIQSKEVIYNDESAFAKKINLIISFSKYFINLDKSAESYISLIKNTLFRNILQTYNKANLILGAYDSYINILNKGDFYENFKPTKTKFTGFDIKLARNQHKTPEKKQQEKTNAASLAELQHVKRSKSKSSADEDYYNEITVFTGKDSINHLSLRTISKINNDKVFNIKKQIFSNEGQKVNFRIPVFKGKSLIEASDGFQYATEKNVIFYYDKFTSNVFNFEYKSSAKFSDINCDLYQLANTIETALIDKNSVIIKNAKSKINIFFKIFFLYL